MRFAIPTQVMENNSIMAHRNEAETSNNTVQAKWRLGCEYEFAYCSNCGRQEYAGWNSTAESIDKISKFNESYRYCPWCGAKMY